MAIPFRPVLVAALALGAGPVRAAPVADPASCTGAIAVSEREERLPAQVLGAIGIVESGRVDPRTRTVVPWPWTINVAGTGHVFDTAADAIAAVRTAQAAGIQSIDVGCMQVNLFHHPHAFVTLEDAFDPVVNVRYAAGFLVRLHAQAGSWPAAVAAYHSATAAIGVPYAQHVAMLWPMAARYGMTPQSGPAAPDPAAAAEQAVDPARILTPEFRARMVAEAAFRRQRDAALGAMPPPGLRPVAAMFETPETPAGRRRPAVPEASLPEAPVLAAARAVDPGHVLTPEFRASRLADAAFRQRRDAAFGWVHLMPAPAAAATAP
jgi:hypothetical protein